MNNKLDFYIPTRKNDLKTNDIDKWFENSLLELQGESLNDTEKEFLTKYYIDAGLLNSSKRKFFSHHYSRTVAMAVNNIFLYDSQPKIIDLGAGTGSQSILFALLGAEVLAIDMDGLSLGILEKRMAFYESLTNKKLKITILNSNVFDIDFMKYEEFDSIYSLFSFNMMQPTSKLLPWLVGSLKENSQIIIQDGNKNNWYNRLFRKRNILSKNELQNVARDLGFTTINSVAGYVMPPFLWKALPNSILGFIDNILGLISDVLPVTYIHIFKK